MQPGLREGRAVPPGCIALRQTHMSCSDQLYSARPSVRQAAVSINSQTFIRWRVEHPQSPMHGCQVTVPARCRQKLQANIVCVCDRDDTVQEPKVNNGNLVVRLWFWDERISS